MNLTAMLCQMPSPAYFTFYKQNNNKNVKKAGDHIWQRVAVKFISLYTVAFLQDFLQYTKQDQNYFNAWSPRAHRDIWLKFFPHFQIL